MEANDFVSSLKAENPEKHNCDLRKVIDKYKSILSKIPSKDRGLFGLNVLRTLCWNLEKAPKWRDSIDNTSLLTLAIDCVRDTRTLEKEDRAKTLACIYHIHKYAVRLIKPVPPELILKISFMPFELDSKHLLKEYHKTYWNILTDRLTYIERLKTKANILKVLPKLTEDIAKVIQIYNTTQFCSTILTFLVKKLHFIYSENHSKELSGMYKEIFANLAEKEDLKLFKGLTERESLEMYMKLNDCLYIVVDNLSKLNFKDDILEGIVHSCIALVGHCSDLFHCLQTFYLNFFCSIVSEKTNLMYVETVFNSLENSLETAEKLGYKNAMHATYPYINQLLRLFIEWQVTNVQTSKKFSLKIQESCLKLILFFTKKLKDCDQILKCENCTAKTGLHDGLRLSFLTKHFITICLSQKILLTTLFDTLNLIIKEQYTILSELKRLGCANYQKYYRKLQTDIHNAAITLNKAQYYEFSINLFEIYLRNELNSSQIDHKNITRALFNKSICELDSKLFEKALIDAFLSLIFSQEEGLKTDKYMSLVMDIKAKELKSRSEDDDDDLNVLQVLTVVDACKMSVKDKLYGDLTRFISKAKFSILLHHEFSQYAKLWPSIAPIGGVWSALRKLYGTLEDDWITVEDKTSIQETLYSIILETPSVVRTIHSTYFSTIVQELLDEFDTKTKSTADEKLVHASLLFLQCEYDLAAASLKYDWKPCDPVTNQDSIPSNRTLQQEHAATTKAMQALQILQSLMPDIYSVSKPRVRSALQIYQIFVPLLLQLSRDAPALQLAYYCIQIADFVDDQDSYLQNAGFLLSACEPCSVLDDVITRAGKMDRWGDTQLVFLCDVALYYIAQGSVGAAARLVRFVQAEICEAILNIPEPNLDLAIGRLMEAQNLLCKDKGSSDMTAVNTVQRHYLSVSVTGSKWSARRYRQLTLRCYTSHSTVFACALPAALGLHARARAGAQPALPTGGAGLQATLYAMTTTVGHFDEAQIKVDTRLKRILGLQPSSEAPDFAPVQKQPPFTPKQEVETMRDVKMYRKNQISPSLPWISVPPINVPEFFKHSHKCDCYGCQIPIALILSCKTSSLEAQIYAFANENEIARNYFQGFLEMVKLADVKLKQIEKNYKEMYEDFIVNSVVKKYVKDFKSMYIESLIELAFFELKLDNVSIADGYIIEIHEIIQEIGKIKPYLTNEVLNLMAASAKLKENTKKLDIDINDFENISISPAKIETTPEKRAIRPPKQDNTKIKVKDEEIPKKRSLPKQIKIDDIDDESYFENPVKNTRQAKKDGFKAPNPIIRKPVLEEATPRPKSVPKILLTQPSTEIETNETPKIDFDQTPNKKLPNTDFFTPATETPDQFFTPITSIKTYTKKSLRHNIVKNLQQEFSTPGSVRKENKQIKEVGSSIKENNTSNRSSRKEIGSNIGSNVGSNTGSNTKSKFFIKEDDVNELSSNLKDKLTLKTEKNQTNSIKKEVSTAVKEDRSVIRELNSNKSEENTKSENSRTIKKNRTITKENKPMPKQDTSQTKEHVSKIPKKTTKEDLSTKERPTTSKSRKDLVRAVSPGKLSDKSERENNTRSRRVRQLNIE